VVIDVSTSQPFSSIQARESRDHGGTSESEDVFNAEGHNGWPVYSLSYPPRMLSASRPLRRPWVASVLPLRNLQRSSRNLVTICRPSPTLADTKSLGPTRPLGTKSPSPPPESNTMSTHAHTNFEEGNVPYVAAFEDKGKLAIPPAKHLAIGSSIHDAA
jgi:hypothetical protein